MMKLEIARSAFLVAAVGVIALAVTAWTEPGPQVLVGSNVQSFCRLPANAHSEAQAEPDQDLLLLMYGLSKAMRS